MKSERRTALVCISIGACALTVGSVSACGDDAPVNGGASSTASSSASAGGATSSSAGGSTSASGGAGGATSSAASSTSSTGGGGSGGAAVTCLDASVASDLFTIADTRFCIVAEYTTDEDLQYQAPTWGSHGGPLLLRSTSTMGSVDVVRFAVPKGAMGTLTKSVTTIDAMIPDGAFLGAQAVDLPFFGWTAISWEGTFPMTQGEIILLDGASVSARYPANGVYGLVGVGAAMGQGRLLHTGLSKIDDAMSSTNGLYAEDSCGTSMSPSLEPSGMSCASPELVSAWGDYSGPVVADANGDVFAAADDAATSTTEIRGFDAQHVARGGAPFDGVSLMSVPGTGSSLAALAPTSTGDGTVFFQPVDATTFAPGDVVEQDYATSSGVAPTGTWKTALGLTTAGTALTLMVDDQARLWVGATSQTGARFVVIARTP